MFFRIKNLLAVLIVSAVIGAVALTGCSTENNNEATIVTTVYPFEFVAREIVGDEFTVVNITPVGAEPHDTELTPSTTAEVLDADLAIVVGEGFQPAVEKTASSRDGTTLELMDTVDGDDPHIWLDPIEMEKIINEITDSVVDLKPEMQSEFEKHRDSLLSRVGELDASYEQGLGTCETRTFVTSHDAFSRLANRYDLDQESIAGISPENEPSPERLSDLAKLVDANDITVIFTEELVSKKVADTLSREAGIRTEELSPIEGLTNDQIKDNEDYFSLMNQNLVQLSDAMRCSS